jgi:hypothetical protein
MKHNKTRTLMVMIVVFLLITVSISNAQGRANPKILPPVSAVQGLSYGEWSALWWQSILSIPALENPAVGAPWTDCYFDRIGNVGLGVAFFSPSGSFACKMPTDTMLFIPLATIECSTLEPEPFYGSSEKELRTCARGFEITDLQASLDGIPINNLSDYIVTSPIFDFTVPDDNILGVPAGSGQSVSYGAWLMFAPLNPGEHTLHLNSTIPDFGVTFDRYYDITVTH